MNKIIDLNSIEPTNNKFQYFNIVEKLKKRLNNETLYREILMRKFDVPGRDKIYDPKIQEAFIVELKKNIKIKNCEWGFSGKITQYYCETHCTHTDKCNTIKQLP